MTTSLIGGFGVVGLGVPGEPQTTFTRADLCADHNHPGVTYNPWMKSTWCLCGQRVQPGNHVPATTDHGLTIWWPDEYAELLFNPQPKPAGWEWSREIGGVYCHVADRPQPIQLDLFGAAA